MELEKTGSALRRLWGGERRVKLILLIGLLGMALILLSQLTDRGQGGQAVQQQALRTAEFTSSEDYVRHLEERLQALISQIEGVGRNKVMVTLESGVEYVFAQEQRRSTDATTPGDIATGGRMSESVEERIILVDTEFGRREALVLTRLPPRVQGVVIVCEGADNVHVEQKLISVVTTALGISSTRVSVVKIS